MLHVDAMKIAEFNELFEKIEKLVQCSEDNEECRLEAVKQLNLMGEELIKAEGSMDKFRGYVEDKRKELAKVLAQTGAHSGNERPRALAKSLKNYKMKWKNMQNERTQLRNEYDMLNDQLKMLKAGLIPDKMRPNLQSLTKEQPTKQLLGPRNLAFYNL